MNDMVETAGHLILSDNLELAMRSLELGVATTII
jgi:hypothetical protein